MEQRKESHPYKPSDLDIPETGQIDWVNISKALKRIGELSTLPSGEIFLQGFIPVILKILLISETVPDATVLADCVFVIWTCCANPSQESIKDSCRLSVLECGGIPILCKILSKNEPLHTTRFHVRNTTAQFCSACALWNISRTETLRGALRASKLVDAAFKILSDVTQPENIKFFCSLTLANLTGGEDSLSCLEEYDSLSKVVEALKEGKSPEAVVHGANWHKTKEQSVLDGLVMSLRCLCSREANQARACELGVVPLLIEVLNPQLYNTQTHVNAAEALHHLSFNASVLSNMKESPDNVLLLQQLISEGRICSSALGHVQAICFRLEKRNPLMVERGKTLSGGWVMLSYNWTHQEIFLELQKILQDAGFKVWIDVSTEEGLGMTGAVNDAMSRAVEGAAVLVVGMSSSYQMSANCRLELEYAHQLNKPFVPLLMESEWKASGWLGLILGSKLYIDLTQPAALDTKRNEILKEISGIVNTIEPDNSDTFAQVSSSRNLWGIHSLHSQKSSQAKRAKEMNVQEVGVWLESVSLSQLVPAFAQLEVDGHVLYGINKLGFSWETLDRIRRDFYVSHPILCIKILTKIEELFS